MLQKSPGYAPYLLAFGVLLLAGWTVWLAMVPPRTTRGVVVIDPPYEQTKERARITATLAAAHRKWAHGVTVIWYPLKDRAAHGRWKDQLRKLGIPKFLCVDHWLYNGDKPGIYNGAGLHIVNPPYAFTQALPPLLEALRAALAPEGHSGEITTDWLTRTDEGAGKARRYR